MLSKTSKYALRAVLYLATLSPEQRARATDISDALGVPANYLSKILHALARSGLLESERGPRGGFRLAIPAGEMFLGHVVAPFDEIGRDRVCLLGRNECSDGSPCAAHDKWKTVSGQVSEFFQETTVNDLMMTTHDSNTTPIAKGDESGSPT